jgi:cytochrome c
MTQLMNVYVFSDSKKGNPMAGKISKTFLRSWVVASLIVLSFSAAYAQDADSGKKIFSQCKACHSIDGSNRAGPSLKGIVGSKAGAFPGFRFSSAMKNSSIVWDAETLDAFIAKPKAAIPGNVMPYPGLTDAKKRADLVAYLQTLK